ncbi:MFS transporter [Streptomyces silvensis]|uniref:MFS transporter permease n=1 Tax=Streptomyces silvensis TaxID=1765722 RepID=A0A0W7X221_9ACTN|nr:MFS transporter [Streptomyces silvensis]KUF16924.1 MFS transporter permease [Streptomyces silvensis]
MARRDTSRRTKPTAGPGAAQPSPLSDPNYRLFLGLQGLSALGDSFSHVAIPLLVLHQTGSVAQMGLVTGLTGVASIVTGLFAGIVADRVNRRRLLVVTDVARCVLFGMIPLVWLFATPIWLVYAVVPVAGVFAMLFQVTYVTVVPGIVAPGQILKANSHLYGTYAVASAGGPMLAGLVAAAFGPAAVIGIDAGTFAVSAVGILFVRIRAVRPPEAEGAAGTAGAAGTVAGRSPADAGLRGVRREFLTGARFLWRHPVLRPLTLLLGLLTFLTYGITDVLIYRVRHDLGHGEGVVGYVLTAGTLGTLAATLVVARLRGRLGFGPSWIGAHTLSGVALAGLGLTGSLPFLAALAACMLFCTGLGGINSMSLRQEVTPAHLLGRVTSSFWTIHNALGPVGAAAVTSAVAAWGVRSVCLVVGVCVVAVTLSGTLTGVGRARTGRTGEAQAP